MLGAQKFRVLPATSAESQVLVSVLLSDDGLFADSRTGAQNHLHVLSLVPNVVLRLPHFSIQETLAMLHQAEIRGSKEYAVLMRGSGLLSCGRQGASYMQLPSSHIRIILNVTVVTFQRLN